MKDVVGPNGCVSIVAGQGESEKDGDDLSDYADVDADRNFSRKDEILSMEDEPDNQELCDREQAFFLRAIKEDLDLSESMDAAVNSLRIVLAAKQSIQEERAVTFA